ncbi:MAG: phosphatidate cytidylyltransferase [Candidatus Heimdallarchaeota archaeon]|nr:phosphatidate cytidylyltransferase [Candidatus Heimdallarchaeota archaeon]
MGYITLLPDQPLIWNIIIGVVAALIYVKGTIFLMDKMVTQGKLSSDLSRKVIHIAAGSYLWVWLFIDTSDNFSYLLNIAVPLLFFFTFLYKGYRGSPDDPDVKTMSRTGDPRELLKGTLYFTIIMMIAGTILFGSYAGMLMMAIVGWGDGIAPYIGKKYGKRTYKTFGREKTLEGSIGFFLFAALGSLFFWIFLGVLGGIGTPVLANPGVELLEIFIVILLCSFVATIVEALSPADIDNLLIPASTIVTLLIVDFFLFAGASFVLLKFPFI